MGTLQDIKYTMRTLQDITNTIRSLQDIINTMSTLQDITNTMMTLQDITRTITSNEVIIFKPSSSSFSHKFSNIVVLSTEAEKNYLNGVLLFKLMVHEQLRKI